MAKQLGKYEIIRSLGQGAMGEVYLAHHPAIGREVAIKTILPSAAKGEDSEGRFRREAAAAGQLSHPNLVTVFDFDKDGEVLFLVMEFVKGDDLEDLIKQQALSQSQFLEVLAQVCDGLSHAHRNGVIHRDIKPANVRVIRDGKNIQAKVMDFGIARMEDSNMTATGIVMGTVNYMAPEYIRNGHATTQSDLFAVGVMLYECLTGRKPFAGDNTTTILFKIVSDPPVPIEVGEIRGISPSIRQVLDRALAKEPSERFGSADDLAKALRACKDPSWIGTLEQATAMIAKHQLELTQAAPEGTQLLAVPGASAPTSVERTVPAAPTVMDRAVAAPTLVDRPAGAPARADGPAAAPAPAGKRNPAVFAAAGIAALAVIAGGAYVALRPKPESAATATPASAGQGAGPAQPGNGSPAGNPAAASPQAHLAPGPAGSPGDKPAGPVAQIAPVPATPSPDVPKPAEKPTTVPVKPGPAAPEPAKAAPEPAKPAQEPAKPADTSAQKIARLIETDPKQAVSLLQPIVQANPRNPEMQASLLAAHYFNNNAFDFERSLTRALASGVTVKAMIGQPAFNKAMKQESGLRKSKQGGVLPDEVMARILAGL
jgi:serine/threonine-protein kinase